MFSGDTTTTGASVLYHVILCLVKIILENIRIYIQLGGAERLERVSVVNLQ